jgi:hypothetical protein
MAISKRAIMVDLILLPDAPRETVTALHRCPSIIREKAMPVSNMRVAERIARIIAARALSINADGDDPSAGEKVDATWDQYREDAFSVLKTLREPDQEMARAGDVEIWQRMIDAALTEGAIQAS